MALRERYIKDSAEGTGSLVIDEAAYDPSLRFVLVAAVAFVLFLVIVLLNKLIT